MKSQESSTYSHCMSVWKAIVYPFCASFLSVFCYCFCQQGNAWSIDQSDSLDSFVIKNRFYHFDLIMEAMCTCTTLTVQRQDTTFLHIVLESFLNVCEIALKLWFCDLDFKIIFANSTVYEKQFSFIQEFHFCLILYNNLSLCMEFFWERFFM